MPHPDNQDRIRAQTVQGLLDLFDDRASGEAFLHDLIATFVSSGSETLTLMATAATANDRERLAKLAHKLKGLGRNIGAERLADLCHLLETSARDPATDAPALSAAIHAEFADACQQLRHDYGTSR